MVKPLSKQAKTNKIMDADSIDALADRLADKPYGEEKANSDTSPEDVERISVTLPRSMRHILEDVALERKRAKEPSRSVSAITRDALEDYFKKIGKI